MPSFPLKVLRFRRCDPLDVNSLTLVREHNAGSARLSAAYRTDQSDRTDVFWHYHTFDHDTSHCRPMCNSALLEKMNPELSAGCPIHSRSLRMYGCRCNQDVSRSQITLGPGRYSASHRGDRPNARAMARAVRSAHTFAKYANEWGTRPFSRSSTLSGQICVNRSITRGGCAGMRPDVLSSPSLVNVGLSSKTPLGLFERSV